jgi:hypothetical protein
VAEVATEDATLEDDADAAALAIVADAPAKVRRGGGLRLQRCTEKESKPTPSPPTPSPPPPPAHCVKPAIHVVKTGSQRFPDGTEAPAVQPIDVAAELACEKFELRGDWPVGATTYPAKTEVLPKVWDNNLPMVHVMIDGKPDESGRAEGGGCGSVRDLPRSNDEEPGREADRAGRVEPSAIELQDAPRKVG